MTAFYDRMAATSLRLLRKFGQPVTLKSYTVGTYNTSTGEASVTVTETTRQAAIFDYGERQAKRGREYIANTLVQAGDRNLIVDAEGTINMQDRFVIGGKEFVIVGFGEINPGGQTVVYDLHIRGVA